MSNNEYQDEEITSGEKRVRFIIKLVAYALIAFLVYKCSVQFV
jgi:hypothetical protein